MFIPIPPKWWTLNPFILNCSFEKLSSSLVSSTKISSHGDSCNISLNESL